MRPEPKIVYVRDVTIFTKTYEDPLDRASSVLHRLEQAKYSMLKRKVKCVGHIVSEHGVELAK